MGDYEKDYDYFRVHFNDWKRPIYRLWWLIRAFTEVILPIRLPFGSKILSVGSGLGQLEHYLSTLFCYNVYMVDISPQARKLNKQLFGNTNYQTAKAENLPFPNKFFDLVISYDLLEHLEDKEKLYLALTEMSRVLKKRKGINMFHKVTVKEENEIDKDLTHHIKWSSGKWQKWFISSGWTAVKPTSHYIPVWSNRKIILKKIMGAFYLSRKDNYNENWN